MNKMMATNVKFPYNCDIWQVSKGEKIYGNDTLTSVSLVHIN